MSECLSFGIGTTAGTIRTLQRRGIPQPDRWNFSAYSRVETTGNGRRKGFGFGTASWEWDTLSQHDVDKFLDFITANEASATVYISTPTDRGGSTQIFDEFQAIVDRLVDGQGKTLIARTQRPSVFNGVVLNFTHLVEV